MSARPKSGGSEEKKEKREPRNPAEKVVPHDALCQAVFANQKVAQTLFKQWDKDKDKKLNEVEFCKGMKDFLEEHEISDTAIKALWNQTDTNLDGFVTWDEFRIRFVEDPTRNFLLRQELTDFEEDQAEIMEAIKDIVVAMHIPDQRSEYQAEILKTAGVDENSKFSVKVMKSLFDAFANAEKAKAEESKTEVPSWIETWQGYNKDFIAELQEWCFELKDNGKLRIDRFQRRLGLLPDQSVPGKLDYKLRLSEVKVKGKPAAAKDEEEPPPSSRGSARPTSGGKPKAGGKKVQSYQFKSLIPQMQLEWLSMELFLAFCKSKTDGPTRAAPALANWTPSELTRWGIEECNGERCHIFLSDHVQIKKVIKDEETKLPIAYLTFRSELNGLHTQEFFYHCKMWFDKHENVKKIEFRPTKFYRNGKPQNLPKDSLLDFQDWLEYSPVPDEDQSLIQAKEF